MYVCMYVYIHTYIHTYISYICVHVCMRKCVIYIYIYVYTYYKPKLCLVVRSGRGGSQKPTQGHYLLRVYGSRILELRV